MKNHLLSSEYEAYIPCYDAGNSVMAVKRDGGIDNISKSIKSVIRRLLAEYNIDLRSLKKNYFSYIGRSTLIPIPLCLGTVLVPIKVRKTIAVNDGAFAYIALSCVEEVHAVDSAIVRLNCGYEVKSMENLSTLKKRLYLANVVKEKFEACVLKEDSLKTGISQLSGEYGKPATKGDMTMLAYEIMKLRKALER